MSTNKEPMEDVTSDIREELQDLTVEVQKTNNILRISLGLTGNYVCGGTGGWRHVVYLNMTDVNSNYPSGWNLTRYLLQENLWCI